MAAKKKATAKKRSSKKHGAKAAFIREHPDLKPKALADLAKEKGLDLNPGYISSFRSKERENGRTNGATRKMGRPKGSASRTGKEADAEFYRVLKRIGVARAKELIGNIEVYENA